MDDAPMDHATPAPAAPGEHRVVLENEAIRVVVDPAFGGEIVSLAERRGGTEMLMHTPWRDAALRHRRPGFSFDPRLSVPEWWARYGGGMQAMFPRAGTAEPDDGFVHPFHGEACVQRWEVTGQDAASVTMTTDLVTAPVRAERRVAIDGGRLSVRDRLHNRSGRRVSYMFLYHPAFGRPFLDPACTIATSAKTFHYDPVWMADRAALGPSLPWPQARLPDGATASFDRAPAPGSGEFTFGWLADFGTEPWYEIRNPRLGLGLRASWPAGLLSHAWLLRDAGGSTGFPWHGESYTFAIEPASCASGGEERCLRTLAPCEIADFGFDLAIFAFGRAGPATRAAIGSRSL
jgi:hypothetical protein